MQANEPKGITVKVDVLREPTPEEIVAGQERMREVGREMAERVERRILASILGGVESE